MSRVSIDLRCDATAGLGRDRRHRKVLATVVVEVGEPLSVTPREGVQWSHSEIGTGTPGTLWIACSNRRHGQGQIAIDELLRIARSSSARRSVPVIT